MGDRHRALYVALICLLLFVSHFNIALANNPSHSFGTLFNNDHENKKIKNKKFKTAKEVKKPEVKQTFGILLDQSQKQESNSIGNNKKGTKGFGALFDKKSKPAIVAGKKPEDKRDRLLQSILDTLKDNQKSAVPEPQKNNDSNKVAVVEMAKSDASRKPRLELGLGSGWDYAEGSDSVGSLDITKLSRAYGEAYVRWWGLLDIFGPDFGAEAYYFTPTIFRPKICGDNPCADVLDLSINYLSANLLYRLVRPDIIVTPLIGYLYYNFDIPSSNSFVVDHAFQGVSLGTKIRVPLWGNLQMLSLIGSAFATVGDYSESGRITASTGKLVYATALHGEFGVRWDYAKGVFFDLLWQNNSFWFDFANGSARSSYWNMGGRLAIDIPFLSI